MNQIDSQTLGVFSLLKMKTSKNLHSSQLLAKGDNNEDKTLVTKDSVYIFLPKSCIFCHTALIMLEFYGM